MTKEKVICKVCYDLLGVDNVGRPSIYFIFDNETEYVVFEKGLNEMLWHSSRSANFVYRFGTRKASSLEGPGAISEEHMQRIVKHYTGLSCNLKFVLGDREGRILV